MMGTTAELQSAAAEGCYLERESVAPASLGLCVFFRDTPGARRLSGEPAGVGDVSAARACKLDQAVVVKPGLPAARTGVAHAPAGRLPP